MKTRISIKIIVIGVIIVMSILGLGVLSLFKEINEEKHFDMDEINEIQVNMTSELVHIIQTEDSNEVKFHYYGKSMQELKLASEVNDKTVVVGVKRDRDLIPEDMALDIYIPKDYEKNLSIKSLSGAVKMDSFELASFTYSNRSGKLVNDKINADSISLNTYSGSLNVKELNAKELAIVSLSAAVNIDECTADDTRIKNSSGKVRVSYKEFENQNIDIGTKSGSITLELPSTAEFLIEAKTSSGKFKSDFPIKITDKKDIEGQIGTKNNKVLLQTLSGGMKILKNNY